VNAVATPPCQDLKSSLPRPGLREFWYPAARSWASWSPLKLFIGQDTKVFEVQDYTAPERLSITDVGLVKWRRVIAAHSERETAPANTAPVTGPRPVPDLVQAR
jgi:hypothetical protein